MTVKKLSKKPKSQLKENHRVKKATKDFISAGGAISDESKKHLQEDVRFTLKISKSMVAKIDKIRKNQVGFVSRNTWIVQAISEKIS